MKAQGRQGMRNDIRPNSDGSSERTDIVPEVERSSEGRTNDVLAKKAGVGKSNMAYLLSVKRNRQRERMLSGKALDPTEKIQGGCNRGCRGEVSPDLDEPIQTVFKRAKARRRSGTRTDLLPNLAEGSEWVRKLTLVQICTRV